MYRAIVFGATGAVGARVVSRLVASSNCAHVVAVVRRDIDPVMAFGLDKPSEKLTLLVLDYEAFILENESEADSHATLEKLSGFEVAYCCLGTTRGAAGSAEAFRRVDFDYVLSSARAVLKGGAKHFALVTSMGANASSYLLYPQTKGKIEAACKELKFDTCTIVRPGLLERPNPRLVESIAQLFTLKRWRCSVDRVAEFMIQVVERKRNASTSAGHFEIFENAAIIRNE